MRFGRDGRKLKYKRPVDEHRRQWIREQPCAICGVLPAECAHVGLRGLSQKCDDSEAIPLCFAHHDRRAPLSHHTLGKNFWTFHEVDRDKLIAKYQALYAEEFPAKQKACFSGPGGNAYFPD